MPDIGIISIPILLIVILAEIIINYRESLELYNKKDALNNFATGLLVIGAGMFFKVVALLFFSLLYNYRLIDLGSSPLVWLFAILACDLVFYLFHYLGHIWWIFWANHSVHHSSKYYNYSVGVRNHFIHLSYRFLFWAPLCWIGFNPYMILFIDNFTSLYQFLLHTRLIGKLGPLEWFMNTPSHHRVHHGSNKIYIDKNFGGLFIIFDRMFGTFCSESEPPVYGITTGTKDNKITSIVFSEYKRIWNFVRLQPGVFNKFRLLFSDPGNKYSENHFDTQHSNS
ncbi:MAG TPA: sterol desaturase family protein [Bacteroidia bacterium]|nr:sterol desaturase family protein [Bacteroidia bacterium]